MVCKDVERKLHIFISSKISNRYEPIRLALKSMLMETGLVASVYTFEGEASSQAAQKAFLSEVDKSDLCIFLIDNTIGVPDAVYEEHLRAKNSNKHRLYFFCNEKKDEETPLQGELRQAGENIYIQVNGFANFAKIAYERTIQDILDWYRNTDWSLNKPYNLNENISSDKRSTISTQVIQSSSIVTFDKEIFKRYSTDNILVKVMNPYGEKFYGDKKDSSTDWDIKCADFLRVVIGQKAFDMTSFANLKKLILSDYSIKKYKKVLIKRVEAISDYFSGNLDSCYKNISEAYELIKDNQRFPKWLVNDILSDMIFIGKIQEFNSSEASKALDILYNSAELEYYPLLDRFVVYQKSALLNEHFEMLTQSPYTARMGILNHAFDDIASYFNIAVRLGSLKNILVTCSRYKEVLFTKYVDSKDNVLFNELVRICIIEQDSELLSKVAKVYRNSVDLVTEKVIDSIIKSIEILPLASKRFESICILLEHFGYYMNDEQYERIEKFYYEHSNKWLKEKQPQLDSRIGHFILRTAKSIIGRSDNNHVVELALSFLHKRIWAYFDKALDIFIHIDYSKCTLETQAKIMKSFINLLEIKNLVNSNRLHIVLITFVKNANINTSALDNALKELDPDFYMGLYDLEIGMNNTPLTHLDKYLVEARQMSTPNKDGIYFSYSYNPYFIIRNILKEEDIKLSIDKLREMIDLIQYTILNDKNQNDVKEGALLLAIYLRNTYPDCDAWEQFSDIFISRKAEIIDARFGSFLGNGPNVVHFCYLLLKITLGFASFEEVAIGFAMLSSTSERDFIVILKYLGYFLSDSDINRMDNSILGIILNFLLSIDENANAESLYLAITALLKLLHAKSYSSTVLMRLSYLMVNADSKMKVLILREVSKTEHIRTDLGRYILQNGRTSNHYFVKKLAVRITEGIEDE